MFVFNETFTGDDDAAGKAWESMFPSQGGFFRHPDIPGERANFAVFHQLHCLDKIRETYWMFYHGLSAAHEGRMADVPDPEDLPFHQTSAHIGHCVDLLRNGLTCRPDTTLELKDVEVGGVTGFGTEHLCVNWKTVVEFAAEWENYNKDAPIVNHGGSSHKGSGASGLPTQLSGLPSKGGSSGLPSKGSSGLPSKGSSGLPSKR
ncbi:hypothetical protein MMC10_007130 [Thelotrema lepadinum]|nr:hypothetical protein [Thelotrema lepadinum]